MDDERGFVGGIYRFFANVRATYRWLRARLGLPGAIVVLVIAAGGFVWWYWNDFMSRPGMDRAADLFRSEALPVPVLGKLNVAVALFEGDTIDQQRRRVVIEELQKVAGVVVLPLSQRLGSANAVQSAAARLAEDFEASVYIGGKIRDVHGRKLVDLIWFAPAPPQEQWTTVDYLLRDEVMVIPAAGPEHLRTLLPIMAEARIIDVRDTLDQEFREWNGSERLDAGAPVIDKESFGWDEQTRIAAKGAVAHAYAAHRHGLHPHLLQKSIELYADLGGTQPHSAWDERMADSFQRLGVFASGVYTGKLEWQAMRRANEAKNAEQRNGLGSYTAWTRARYDALEECRRITEEGMGFGWTPPAPLQHTAPASAIPTDFLGKPIPQPPGPSKNIQEEARRFSGTLNTYEMHAVLSFSAFGAKREVTPEQIQKRDEAKANFDAGLSALRTAVATELSRLRVIESAKWVASTLAASQRDTVAGSSFITAPRFGIPATPPARVVHWGAEWRMAALSEILGRCEAAFTGKAPTSTWPPHLAWMSNPQPASEQQAQPVAFDALRERLKRRAATSILETLEWEIGRQQLEAAIVAYRASLATEVLHPVASDVAVTQNNLAVALEATRDHGNMEEAQRMYLAAYEALSASKDRRAAVVQRNLDRIGRPPAARKGQF